LTDTDRAWISDRCNALQAEMLVWGRGGLPVVSATFDGTLKTLAACYRSDPDSAYSKKRYKTRLNYDHLIGRLVKDYGHEEVRELKARTLLRWHEAWGSGGRVAMAHALIRMLRTIIGFGSTFLEDTECQRVQAILGNMKFKMAPPRSERLTAAQADAIRAKAHEKGIHSLALAQAIQFECMLRQKDVIGEWVPLSEPGASEVIVGGRKWLRGIRWSQIDGNLILRHVTSKKGKEVVIDLKLAPMVMEEMGRIEMPSSGPVIVSETRARPYDAHEFRYEWRKIAKLAGVPAHVFNMDSRAGAISEATDAGAELEHVRHAATHSDISMTQRYSRAGEEKTAKVMRLRVKHRGRDTA
jgi:hypothetical protein